MGNAIALIVVVVVVLAAAAFLLSLVMAAARGRRQAQATTWRAALSEDSPEYAAWLRANRPESLARQQELKSSLGDPGPDMEARERQAQMVQIAASPAIDDPAYTWDDLWWFARRYNLQSEAEIEARVRRPIGGLTPWQVRLLIERESG